MVVSWYGAKPCASNQKVFLVRNGDTRKLGMRCAKRPGLLRLAGALRRRRLATRGGDAEAHIVRTHLSTSGGHQDTLTSLRRAERR